MCGIVALFAPLPEGERAALAGEALSLLRHRGPDGEGVAAAEGAQLTLGHRRLSIIDLSEGGHQPMARGDLLLTYNGEVYNYLELRAELAARGQRFETESDTEVLLAAFQEWGEGALERANGMFAFCLFDRRRRSLLLGRDRFGVKPLYYLHDAARPALLAASEPKAVLRLARRLGLPVSVEEDVLAAYLADVSTEDDERTFFGGIRRVLPGELLRFDLGREGALPPPQRRAWYHLRPGPQTPEAGPGAVPAGARGDARDDSRFLELFTDAVRLRLRSDVPVGTCLSGGLDSSAIVCVAAKRLGVRPHAFSAVYGRGDPADESRFIDAVRADAAVPGHTVDPAARFSPEDFLRFLSLHDEPVGGTTVWAQHCVFRLAREAGVTVMLDGQGADETLTGYHGAFRPAFADLLRRGALLRLATELRQARRLHGHRPAPGLAGAAWLLLRPHLPAAPYEQRLHRRWRDLFSRARQPAFRLEGRVPPRPRVPPAAADWERRSPLHGYLYQLIYGSSLQTILRYEDRNSMAASIEARAPFLDYRLVEHVLGQPAHALLQGGYTKALLRRALRGTLPDSVRLRTDKIGFATPEAAWLRGPLRPLVADILSAPSLAGAGVLDAEALRGLFQRLLASPETRASSDSYTLFKALNVELWLREQKLTV